MSAIPTQFLPAEKSSSEKLAREIELVRAAPHVAGVLDALGSYALVLNENRQIVFVNDAFAAFLRERGLEPELGVRMGDALDCVNVASGAACGTMDACRLCGGAQAVASALKGRASVKELRLRGSRAGKDFDLKVRAMPFGLQGIQLLLLSITDISDEKRRRALEQIFFHDITNTAGGIRGWAERMTLAEPEEAVRECAPRVLIGANRLLEEITGQRDLAAAESGELQPRFSLVGPRDFLRGLARFCSALPAAYGKTVTALEEEDAVLKTDPALLGRVLVNLIKNALEAEKAGAKILVSCHRNGEHVVFSVSNPTAMAEAVQRQVFQRSFSTKGPGRGLGTYSVRLLSERYLGGRVSFSSSRESGTVFEVSVPCKTASGRIVA